MATATDLSMFSRRGVQAGNLEAQREVQALVDVPSKLQECVKIAGVTCMHVQA